MDNAKIHHGDTILELADRFGILCNISALFLIYLMVFICTGVRIEYLPPYSPDLNPIEEAFSKIKHFIRRHNAYYNTTTGDGILFDMYEVMDIITPDDSDGYFIHAGYF
jgi:transposase